jgi:hypothetical protein
MQATLGLMVKRQERMMTAVALFATPSKPLFIEAQRQHISKPTPGGNHGKR